MVCSVMLEHAQIFSVTLAHTHQGTVSQNSQSQTFFFFATINNFATVAFTTIILKCVYYINNIPQSGMDRKPLVCCKSVGADVQNNFRRMLENKKKC